MPKQVDMQEGVWLVRGKIQHVDEFVVVQIEIRGNRLDLLGIFGREQGHQVHVGSDQRVDFFVLLRGNYVGELGVAIIRKELVHARGRSFSRVRAW